MKETDWVERVAKLVREMLTNSVQSVRIETQEKIPYGYEIRAYRKGSEAEPKTEAISFATDFVVIEDYPDGTWKPRVVIASWAV